MPETQATGASARVKNLFETYSVHSVNCRDEDEAYRRLAKFRGSLNKADLDLFQRAAQAGNPEAMCLLGATFMEAWLAPKDREKAVFWFRKAAEAGNPAAQDTLAGFFLHGAAPSLGFTKNLDEATRLFRLAAQQGFAKSQSNLGVLLGQSPSTAQEGLEWTRKAAEAGVWSAMYNLALAYETGDGVERNQALAIEWYEKVARNGVQSAKEKLRRLRPSWWRQIRVAKLFGKSTIQSDAIPGWFYQRRVHRAALHLLDSAAGGNGGNLDALLDALEKDPLWGLEVTDEALVLYKNEPTRWSGPAPTLMGGLWKKYFAEVTRLRKGRERRTTSPTLRGGGKRIS